MVSRLAIHAILFLPCLSLLAEPMSGAQAFSGTKEVSLNNNVTKPD